MRDGETAVEPARAQQRHPDPRNDAQGRYRGVREPRAGTRIAELERRARDRAAAQIAAEHVERRPPLERRNAAVAPADAEGALVAVDDAQEPGAIGPQPPPQDRKSVL